MKPGSRLNTNAIIVKKCGIKKLISQIISEIKGIFRLAFYLFESIFSVYTEVYSCPACNQTLREYQKACDRCNALIGWE